MKLSDHAEHIRQLIDKAFRNKFGRLGIALNGNGINLLNTNTQEYDKLVGILNVFLEETGNDADAYEKLVEEFTFTLFNRLAALKVMEAHTLHPEILTRRSQHGDRSFAHYLWLEQNPPGRNEELEGLIRFTENQFTALGTDIPLFSLDYPYHLLPTAIELNGIINAFNQVDTDAQVEPDIWKSDDVLGWLYESYNNKKKADHKESGAKTEYNKVSIQSQVYTPRWVVKFLVDNSLGKLYLEMYPNSEIRFKYKIANTPSQQCRERKPLTEIKMIDPANGSGNFLLYGFDLFYDLYLDQIEHYDAEYREKDIAELIIRHNLHGIDLDDRAVQLTQLGLYIKAKRKRTSIKIDHFNIVSSDFFLPDYQQVRHLFENGEPLQPELERIVVDLWSDLQQAYKFGSLIRLEEKFNARINELTGRLSNDHGNLFAEETQAEYGNFRSNFLTNLQTAVTHNAEQQGATFLNNKTQDAITFLSLLTQKYSVAVANPPYTDSGDFGEELKGFINENFKTPNKFNTNLYACFIKRCSELIDDIGYVSLVHTPTFMYIQSFEDVRKYLVEKTHLSLFVEWGYLGMFNPTARVDSVMYIFEKTKKVEDTIFIKLNDLYEGNRFNALFEAYEDLISNYPNNRIYHLSQNKLKIIDGWPFIYWISDEFRDKFQGEKIEKHLKAKKGLGTDNNRFFRFWWEVPLNELSDDYPSDQKKWVGYVKGGPYRKWYGNLWLVINWKNNGEEIKSLPSLNLRNPDTYFKEGIACSLLSSKGTSFRYQPPNYIYDSTTRSIFLEGQENYSIFFYISLLNSKLASYILQCLNSTVVTNSEDIHRIPIVNFTNDIENSITQLCRLNIDYQKRLFEFNLIEKNFKQSPLLEFNDLNIRERIFSFFIYEISIKALILINDALINNLIFDVYNLSIEDKNQVEFKVGVPIGDLPVTDEARLAFLSEINIPNEKVVEHIRSLPVVKFDPIIIKTIKTELSSLFQSNNDLESFCDQYNNQKSKYPSLNPINVWYWFKEGKIVPASRATEIITEFLAAVFRDLLMEDEDGIIPLTGLPGEPKLMDRLEQHCLKSGFTSAQFMQLDGLLGRPLNEYIEHYFFNDLSNLLNLFMYLPKTPFIWHLSSGEYQGFEAYIIIYKWNRDSLFKLKTHYLSKRIENLEYRLIELEGSISAQAQDEKEKIRLQIQEINDFTAKVDELISEGYDPKLDDGVGKNIAPLQKKGMLRAEVLNKKQLEKYLNADW
jgi:hypothetical protein